MGLATLFAAAALAPGFHSNVQPIPPAMQRQMTGVSWHVGCPVGLGDLRLLTLAYRGFEQKGFKLVAVFDADESKVGKKHGPFTIRSMNDLKASVERENIKLGMIAVPADNAQDVADALVAAGVRGLLNFAPVSITVPQDVALNAVDLAVQLEQLSFQVNVSTISPT